MSEESLEQSETEMKRLKSECTERANHIWDNFSLNGDPGLTEEQFKYLLAKEVVDIDMQDAVTIAYLFQTVDDVFREYEMGEKMVYG